MSMKIVLDSLSTNNVSIKKQELNDEEKKVGDPWRVGYANTERGRKKVEGEVDDPELSTIMTMWGNEPTVPESSE